MTHPCAKLVTTVTNVVPIEAVLQEVQRGAVEILPEEDLGLRRGWLVSSGRERRLLSPDIEIIPWAEIASGYFEA